MALYWALSSISMPLLYWSPIFDPPFPMWAHQCLPWSVGEAFPNRSNIISSLLCWEEALFSHGEPVVRKDPVVVLCKTSLQLVSSQLSCAWGCSYSSAGYGVCWTSWISCHPILPPCWGPSEWQDDSCVSHSSWFNIICAVPPSKWLMKQLHRVGPAAILGTCN